MVSKGSVCNEGDNDTEEVVERDDCTHCSEDSEDEDDAMGMLDRGDDNNGDEDR